MRESIRNRISRRHYLDEPLGVALVDTICAKIEDLNRVSGLTMEYLPDASEAFASMRKTYGMFSGVRAVIVMKGPAGASSSARADALSKRRTAPRTNNSI